MEKTKSEAVRELEEAIKRSKIESKIMNAVFKHWRNSFWATKEKQREKRKEHIEKLIAELEEKQQNKKLKKLWQEMNAEVK